MIRPAPVVRGGLMGPLETLAAVLERADGGLAAAAAIVDVVHRAWLEIAATDVVRARVVAVDEDRRRL